MFFQCFLFLTFVTSIKTVNECQTPDGKKGFCKPLSKCPHLVSFFNTKLTPQKAQILRKHQCGDLSDMMPKVCCIKTLDLLPSSCGYTIGIKIIGGERTELDEFPWMALLQYTKSDGSKHFYCGGFLISEQYVLTAAHCINPSLNGVRLGEHNIDTEIDCIKVNTDTEPDCAPPAITIPIEQTHIHEEYTDDINNYNDIALIRLQEKINISDYIKPICLPIFDNKTISTFVGQRLFVAGWGMTENQTTSSVKLKVQIPITDPEECQNAYRRFAFNITLTDRQLCAGGEKKKDSCKGDSGGPLMTIRKDQWYVAGIASFGPMPCGKLNWSGIYTKVEKYITWIESKLQP